MEPAQQPRRGALVAALAVAFVALAVWAQTVAFDFVNWDDNVHLWENRHLLAPRPLTLDFWLTPTFGYPIAIPNLSFLLQRAAHGLRPAGFHLANVALHALNAVLVFALMERLRLGRVAAIAAALLFAVHPLAAEPVAWVTGRKDLLATAFGVGALLVWRREGPSERSDAAANALFALAALSKPSVFTLPLVVLVVRGTDRRALLAIAPAMAFAGVLALAIVLVPHGGDQSLNAAIHARLPLRALRTLGYSLGLFVPRGDLRPVYVLPPARWTEPATLAGVLFAVGYIAALATPRVRRSRAFALLALFAITMAPALNVLPLNKEIGDCHLYLPLIAVAGLVMLGVESVSATLSRTTRLALYGVLPVVCLSFALSQATIWQNGVALWSYNRTLHPNDPRICNSLGSALGLARRSREALATFEHCARLQGDRRPYLYNMAVAARDAGDGAAFFALIDELAAVQPAHPLVVRARQLRGAEERAAPR